VQSEFVATCASAGPAFESAEEILYPVANSIVPFRIKHYSSAVGFSRDAVPMTEPFKFCPQFVAVEAFVRDQQHRAPLCLEQFDDVSALIGLPGNEFHTQSPAAQIGDHHQFGVSSASGLAHSLRLRSAPDIGRTLMHQDVCSVHQPDSATAGFADPAQHPFPQTGACPLAMVSKNGLPWAEFPRQITPRTGVSQPLK